jgi:hypothetical protein
VGHYGSEIDPDWGLSREERLARYHERAAAKRLSEQQAEARIRAAAVPAIAEMQEMEEVTEDMGVLVHDIAWWCSEHDIDYGHSKTLISHVLYQLVHEGVLVRQKTGGFRLSEKTGHALPAVGPRHAALAG